MRSAGAAFLFGRGGRREEEEGKEEEEEDDEVGKEGKREKEKQIQRKYNRVSFNHGNVAHENIPNDEKMA